jgi:hypothetical protein
MSRVSNKGGGYRDGAVHTCAAFFEAFHNDHLVGNIHPSGGDVEGFGDPAPGVIQEAAQGAHGPIVRQGSAEERLALRRGEGEAPAKGIVEVGCVIYDATEYKCSVTIGETLRAEATKHLASAPRRRAGQKRFFAPVWGRVLHLASDNSKNAQKLCLGRH